MIELLEEVVSHENGPLSWGLIYKYAHVMDWSM